MQNLFLLLEDYLAAPGQQLKSQIVEFSETLVSSSYKEAQAQHFMTYYLFDKAKKVPRDNLQERAEFLLSLFSHPTDDVRRRLKQLANVAPVFKTVTDTKGRPKFVLNEEIADSICVLSKTLVNEIDVDKKLTTLAGQASIDARMKMEKLRAEGEVTTEDVDIRTRGELEIGGDEWMSIFSQNMETHAKDAYPISTRMVLNQGITNAIDPTYIFKLNTHQLNTFKQQFMSEVRPGMIVAFVGYIERRKESNFSYCSELAAAIYDHNALLRLKAKSLEKRGFMEAAGILMRAHQTINHLCKSVPDLDENSPVLKKISEVLCFAKASPAIQRHRGIGCLIVEFLNLLSRLSCKYLPVTASSSNTFWHRPTSDTENILDRFIQKANPHGLDDEQTHVSLVR